MKEIQTNGITIFLVEVSEDAINFRLKNGYIWYDDKNFKDCCILEPQGNYQILGKSIELSEEHMKEICSTRFNGAYYHDYLNEMEWFDTVQESYLSLLEANGIVDRNPISDEQKNVDRFWQVEWQESQSKVKHYLVLKRI